MGRLSGKVALVTGAALGIGAACVRRLREAGARVALVDLHDGPGQQLAAELGVAPTAIALAYVLAQPFPTFPLFGPRSIEETRTSMAGLDVTLTDEQVRWLDLRA